MDPKSVAQQFMSEYYGALMQNRANLLNFYTNQSTMTYNGDIHKGIEEIKDKIESFGFKSINYQIADFDVQEGSLQGSLIIFCVGTLTMDDDPMQFKFSQVFNIMPNQQGGLYIHNDIFRTVLG